MTPDSSPRIGLHPSIVLPAYIEPLIRGRRVAVLGDATVGLAEELAQRGARLVHAYDPDPARAAEALARLPAGRTHQISFAVLAGDLGVRDGAFDAVIVPDLAIFLDPTELMRRVRKLCAAAGVAVVVAPNVRTGARLLLPEAPAGSTPRAAAPPGYYELYDLVSLQFPKVRMVGQAPFVGYTVADFAPGSEPEVSVDTSLLTASEEPEYFIAVAGERTVSLEAYAVIELPWAEVIEAQGAAPAREESARAAASREEERLALTEARARLELVSAELEKVRDQHLAEGREAQGRASTAATHAARVIELELESEAREGRLRELEGRSGDNHVRAERLANQIRDMDEELRRQRDRGTRLTKQLDDEKKARTKAEVELGMIRGLMPQGEASPTQEPRAGAPEVVDTFELGAARVNAALREATEAAAARDAAVERARRAEARAQRTQDLEAALAEEERARANLLEQQRSLESQLAAMERRLAEARGYIVKLDAELASARAALGPLEARVARAEQRPADLEQRLAAAQARAADLESRLGVAQTRAAEIESRLAAAQARTPVLESRVAAAEAHAKDVAERLAEASQKPIALEAELAVARERAAELDSVRASAEAATAELTILEAALRERGQLITSLKRDLREGERIGRELLDELTQARATNGAGTAAPVVSVVNAVNVTALEGQLDRLAQSAARSQADLQAATWRIAQLERELRDAAEPPEATEIQADLEAALAAARDEVASLRRVQG